MNFQDLILTLQNYWNQQGCLLIQPYDVEKGAGTFNPATFLRSLGPEPFSAAYPEPCRRPTDGRYGDNPIRMQHYYQFQVILKPSPKNIVDLYIGSLKAIGIHPEEHDIRFVHDDWETAALGAWGLGWEVWCDGTEVTQFTYFQQVGGIELGAITGEITYGLERLCMFLQGVDSVFDLQYNDHLKYGDLFHQNEVQFSKHNFELADTDLHYNLFKQYASECQRLCEAQNPAPALDYAMKASHTFNILDARSAISVNERQGYVLKIRNLAKQVATTWLESREALGHPLLHQETSNTSKETSSSTQVLDIQEKSLPLLIELGVEEMPSKVFQSLLKDLPLLWEKYVDSLGLNCKDVVFQVTPRRIAITASSIETKQDDTKQELKGPPANIAKDQEGNWTPAALGFAKKNNLDPDQLETRTFGKAEYLYAESMQKGKTAAELLGKNIPVLFEKIHWYKTMRWGTGNETPFVRPVQWLVPMLGSHVIPMEFAGVASSNQTMGHRFLANHVIEVDCDSYHRKLREAYVLVDQAERKATIQKLTQEVAEEKGLLWREDEELLEHVSYLVEYPFPILGEFEERYLELPEEVIVSEMREHQKYFALTDKEGKLYNGFVAISNMKCQDTSLVRKGYENVLISRLFDGEFFLKEDRKVSLKERIPKLSTITFDEKLGSVQDKVSRTQSIAASISILLKKDQEEQEQIQEIALLAKTDLTTAMVYEFPDLQGEMGRYYALEEGYPGVIANGIRDQYLPKDAYDNLPPSDSAAIVGLADRIDSIVGLFSVGKIPTGSADPYALRRACLACINIIVYRKFSISVSQLVDIALNAYPHVKGEEKEELTQKIEDFFYQRTKKMFQEKTREEVPGGFSWDIVESVLFANSSWDKLYNLSLRLIAMDTFQKSSEFTDVAATFKRVSNILEEDASGEIDTEIFHAEEEVTLYNLLLEQEPKLEALLVKESYVEALELVGSLRHSVDALFEAVRINDPDKAIKQNRSLLIQKVRDVVKRVADFSKIQDS
jgi:glycyl-tRNA synthetase